LSLTTEWANYKSGRIEHKDDLRTPAAFVDWCSERGKPYNAGLRPWAGGKRAAGRV
jgi:hypothetical protein